MDNATLPIDPETIDYQERAGKGRRLLGLLIDWVFCLLFAGLLGVILALAGLDSVLKSLENPLLDRLFGIVIFFLYYLFFETLFARTVGKLITGTRVVMEDGSQPTFGVILKRSLLRLVPFEGFTFLGEGGGLHDTKSDTTVVRN